MLGNKQLKECISQKSILNISLLEKMVSNVIDENQNIGIKHHGKVEVEIKITPDESCDKAFQLQELDVQVLNAVFTFWKHDISEFSIAQLIGMIYGDFEGKHRDKIKAVVAESVEKLTKHSIHINAKQEFEHYNKLRGVDATFSGKLLDIEVEISNGRNGKRTKVYRIRNPSPMMQYADALKHVAKIDMRWYQLIPKRSSLKSLSMCEGLLCRIAQAKNPHNHMYKGNMDIMILGWDKNKKRFSGIVGSRLEEFDKRKVEKRLDILKSFWEELKRNGLVSEFEWNEIPYNYGTMQYKKIYIRRVK